MPTSGLDYDAHGRLARVRKKGDKDNRSTVSSSSSRKHRDSSASSGRTPVALDTPTQASDPTPQNVNLDQLPDLPESGPDSPSSATSPMNRTISSLSAPTAIASASPHHLPATVHAYYESVDDLSTTVSSRSTLKEAEKAKEPEKVKEIEKAKELEKAKEIEKAKEPVEIKTVFSKPLTQDLSSDTPRPTQKPLPEPSLAAPTVSSSQATTLIQTQRPKSSQPSETGRGSQVSGVSSPAPMPALLYGSGPYGEHFYYPPQYAYHSETQTTGSPPSQQGPPSQALTRYLDYGAPQSGDHRPLQQLRHPHAQADHHGQTYPPQILPAETPPPGTSMYGGSWDRGPASGFQRLDENTSALFQRIQRVIPDLHALMSLHHDTCGILEASQMHIRDTEAKRAAESRQLEIRIAQMGNDLESVLNKHSAESSRLKAEINSLDKRCKELRDKIAAGAKHNEALQASNESLRAEQKQMEKRHQEENSALANSFQAEKEKMVAEHRTNQRAVHDDLQLQTRIAEAKLSRQKAELHRASEEEKQDLQSNWTRQRRELEDRQASLRRDLENTLEAKQKVVDEERRTYLQAREGWDREREALTRRWEEERSILQRAWEEQRKALTIKYQREKDDILRQSSQARTSSEAEAYVLRLQREIESLKAGWDFDKFKFQRTTADFKATAKALNEQNSKLQKMMETFGESLDAKGR